MTTGAEENEGPGVVTTAEASASESSTITVESVLPGSLPGEPGLPRFLPGAAGAVDQLTLEESDFESRGRSRSGIPRPAEKGLLSSYARVQKWSPQWERGRGGTIIGISLVGIFGAFLAIALTGAIVVVAKSSTAADAEIYATVLANVLEATGNFAASVFAPLLAFVLGYYFGEKNRESGPPQEHQDPRPSE